MDRVFSADDMADQFWSPPPVCLAEEEVSSSAAVNRSSSVWAFERFLHESNQNASESSPPSSSFLASGCSGGASSQARPGNDANVKDRRHPKASTAASATASINSVISPSVPMDSDEYQAFLKSRLNLACAAVALTRASYGKPEETAAVAEKGVQASNTSQLESQLISKGAGCDSSKAVDKDVSGPHGMPSLPTMKKTSGTQVKSATSGSEQSDDDDLEGEAETTENMNPADAKRVRRMLSNRESARRSRRRKQAHLTELETQVSQLCIENSSLLRRLTDVSQKYNEAAVDNRVLKADVETLRAKVKMAEETVKRVTGLNPLLQAMSEISTLDMPSFSSSPSDTSTDAAVPVQDDPKQHFYQPTLNNHTSTHNPGIQNGFGEIPPVDNVQQNPVITPCAAGNKMGRTVSMQQVASLEHLEKRICGGASPCSNQGNGEQ